MFALAAISFAVVAHALAARGPLHSLPEDPFAFPKYRVSFLNGHPVLNETADKWLRDGLRGGDLEFLDQPWHEVHWDRSQKLREIGSGQEGSSEQKASSSSSTYSLELMKLGPRMSYLCLIPPHIEQPDNSQPEESPAEVTLAHSWSLLQPLAGSCIYHRQGWFTYAYCHNSHVRQFREAIPTHPVAPGTYQIQEDQSWEAYDLGRAPRTEAGADLTVAEQAALSSNLEVARGAGSRYLVQRWGDGSVCDKTGRRREIEVQFHCSMTMTDSILFVKETKTCHYVLVVNTPRLCGEPGFKSRLDQREEAFIRCREVVDAEALAAANPDIPEADHPIKLPRRTPLPPGSGAGSHMEGGGDDQHHEDGDLSDLSMDMDVNEDVNAEDDPNLDDPSHVLRLALERILNRQIGEGAPRVIVEDAGDGEMVIELITELDVDEQDLENVDLDEALQDAANNGMPDSEAIMRALRAAGYEVQGEVPFAKEEGKQKKRKQRQKGDGKEEVRAGRQAQGGIGRDEL